MILICRTDKFVIGCIHQIPDTPDLTCHVVHVLLRRDACCLCLQFDLLTMLVGTCLEKYVVALHSSVAGNAVCQHDLIRVADVRLSGRISDRGRHIILWFTLITHVIFLQSMC